MKKYLLLILISILFFAKVDAQIIWGFHSIDADSCSFKSNCNFIKMDTSTQNIWQQGVTNKLFFNNVNGIFTDSIHFYPKNNHSFFEIKIPKVYIWSTLLLTFVHKIETDSSRDGGYIEYYNNEDSVWYNIGQNITPINYVPIRLYKQNVYSEKDSLFNGQIGFSGTQNYWVESKIEWIWMLTMRQKSFWNDSLKIRFHFISDSIQTNKAGWIIKDFMVTYIDLGSGINEVNSTNSVSIFPNPTTSTFTISKNTNEALQFHLYNLIGQQVLNKNLSEIKTTIDWNNLATGTYLFSITNASGKIIDNGKLIFE